MLSRFTDLCATAAVIQCTADAVAQGLVASAHDCADGGIAVALAECCIAGGRGASVALAAGRRPRADELLFGEGVGRILVSASPSRLPALLRLAERLAVPVQVLGTVSGERLIVGVDGDGARGPWIDASVADLARARSSEEGAPR